MVAGHVGDAGHRVAGEVGGDPHQEQVGDDRAGDDDGNGEDTARQQVGIDPVGETEDEGEPDQVHDQRDAEADAVDGVAGKVAALGVDDVLRSCWSASVLAALTTSLGIFFTWGSSPMAYQPWSPWVVSTTQYWSPIISSRPWNSLHAEGGAERYHHQQQYCVGYFIGMIVSSWNSTVRC